MDAYRTVHGPLMDAYRAKDGGMRLTPRQQVARASRSVTEHYKSHRTVPGNVTALFPWLMQEIYEVLRVVLKTKLAVVSV